MRGVSPKPTAHSSERPRPTALLRSPTTNGRWRSGGAERSATPATCVWRAPRLDPDIGRKWTRSLRAFDRTLALDSTFHLAYAHKLSVYQIGGTEGQPMIVIGDSVVVMPNDSVARAIGAERVRSARVRARQLALLQAKHWRYLDPDAPQAHAAVVDSYAAAGYFDSAASALREAMARPTVRTPDMAYSLAALEMLSGSPNALATLRNALET